MRVLLVVHDFLLMTKSFIVQAKRFNECDCKMESLSFLSLDDSNKCDIITVETVQQLINEIGKIKTQMNNTELQLYEANEKIAELTENVSTM